MEPNSQPDPLYGLPFEQAALERLSARELGVDELQSRLESSAMGPDALNVEVSVSVSW
jgi:hypothetical protein